MVTAAGGCGSESLDRPFLVLDLVFASRLFAVQVVELPLLHPERFVKARHYCSLYH